VALFLRTTAGDPAQLDFSLPDMGRLSQEARGYGAFHRRTRRYFTTLVDAGLVRCARCGGWIAPGERWDLGHHDWDRSIYTGPGAPRLQPGDGQAPTPPRFPLVVSRVFCRLEEPAVRNGGRERLGE